MGPTPTTVTKLDLEQREQAENLNYKVQILAMM